MNTRVLLMLFVIAIGFFSGLMVVTGMPFFIQFAFIAIILCVFFAFVNPSLIFKLLLFSRPLIDPLRNYSFIGYFNVLGIFSFLNVILIPFAFIRDRGFKIFPPTIKWFYAFIVIATFSIFNSAKLADSIAFIFKLLSLCALFLLSYNLIKHIDDAKKILNIIIYSSIVPIVYGIFQVITKQGVIQDLTGYIRLNSTFAISNPFAFYLGIVILTVLLLQISFSSTKFKFLHILITLCGIVCLYFTYVRAIWIALAISLIIMALIERKIRKLLFVFSIVILLFFSEGIANRFQDISQQPKKGTSSLEFRFIIAEQLIKNALPHHVIIGSGIGTSEDVAGRFTDFQNLPHNDYLRVLLETGVLGLITYGIFLLSFLKFIIKRLLKKNWFSLNVGFGGIFIYYLVASFGQNCFTAISASGYIFCLMGLAVKINELPEKTKKTK